MLAWLPTINATLNGIAFLLLLSGYLAIRRKNVRLHKTCMISALSVSAAFLACYLVYHFNVLSKKYEGPESLRTVYYLVLVPHIILAIVMLPMIFVTFRRALAGNFDAHKRIAKPTLATWMYVSVTGVVVYLMLYHLPKG
jgi:putative membrane protein